MLISPFTPLFFLDPKVDGIESPYIQTFGNQDRIVIQLIGSKNNPGDEEWSICLLDLEKEDEQYLHYNHWYINESDYVNFAVLQGLSDGTYCVRLENPDYDIVSAPFRVTSDASILRDTTLLQYSMRNNRQRKDAVFIIDNMHYFFEFRIPGGFKDNGWTFGVDSEQFKTDIADPIQLYGRENTLRKLTVGTSEGCPIWFGELLNRLLCCNYIYVDGVRYARADNSVPEISNTLEGVNSFIITQNLQQVINDDLLEKYAYMYHIKGGIYDPDLNRRFNDKSMVILRSLGSPDVRISSHEQALDNKLRKL